MGNGFIEKLQQYWHTITVSRRIILGIAIALVISIFITMIFWMNKDTYRLLYRNVTPEEASAITQYLTENNIPYVLSNNDQDIAVPSKTFSKIRLKIAGDPSFNFTGKGFELFDSVQVGQTDFVQKINYQRALQGELSRTIMEFPTVAKARVHLVLPNPSLFVENTVPPSASVVLTLKNKASMGAQETQTIVNLLSMSIEGLTANNISIVDTAGNTLYSPSGENSLQGMTTTQLEYTTTLQNTMEKRIEELLIPIVGKGKSIAKVAAQLDFNQKTIRKEEYNPDTIAVRSEQTVDNTQKGTSNLLTGVPDTNFRADTSNGTSTQESVRTSKTINYEISKEEQSIISAVGSVEKLSIAVVVDGNYIKDAEGKSVFTPKTEEELNTIKELVASAVGFDSARGDILQISSAPFPAEDTLLADDTTAPLLTADQIGSIATFLFNGALVFLFLIFVIKPLVGNFVRPHTIEELVHSEKATTERALVQQNAEMNTKEQIMSIEEIRVRTQELCDNHMLQVVAILRNWMQEDA